MAKSKKPKPSRAKNPEQAAQLRRAAMHALALLVFIGLLTAAGYRMKQYVESDVLRPDHPPKIVLKNRPPWMSDALASQITHSLQPTEAHSAFDRQLLVNTAAILNKNPWISQIHQIRRAYDQSPGDTLEVDCDFRAPIALLHWKDYYWLVDGQAVKLPEQFTAEQLPAVLASPDGKVNIRIVEGVAESPVESGHTWNGDDLVAALDMVKLLYGRPFADEITRVDVSNFAGRVDPREAQVKLITKYGTSIQWGRPVNAKDIFVEVPPAQKLDQLETIYRKFHRIDAGRSSIDIRLDTITYPNGEATAGMDSQH